MLRAVVALILFAGLIYIVDLEASVPPFCVSGEPRAETNKQNENCAPLSRAVVAYGATTLVGIGHLVHDYKEEIIAAFTVVLAIATGYLWKATRDLVNGAENTAKRQLRAYLVVEGTHFDPKPGKFVSHFRIENTGQTPARKVRVLTNTCILPHPLKWDFDFSLAEQLNPSSSSIGSNKNVSSASSLVATETSKEEFDEALADNGWLRIYTYGTVAYDDVFGDAQWTNFCFYFQWEANEVAATVSEYHNDAS